MRKGQAYHGTHREVPGQHAWLAHGSVSEARGLWRCRKCGVVVETCAPFPDRNRNERWNGVWMRRKQERPKCGGVACT